MFGSRVTRPLFLLLVALLVGINVPTNAHRVYAHGDTESKNPTIIATKDGITAPKNLSSGMATITIQNDTKMAFSPMVARFNKGKTMQDFMGAMQKGPAEALAVVTLLGSPEVAAATSVDVTYDLLAGDYFVLSFKPDGPPDMVPFTVAENKDAVTKEPEADGVVTLVDFAFSMPGTLKAGKLTFKFANTGKQTHEMVMFRVPDNAKLDDVKAALIDVLKAAPDQPSLPKMPYETAFTWTAMSPETHAWATLDLTPGRYAVVCFIPDATSKEMASHLQHGMITLVTVSK